jgi:hypothetical protein
MDGCTCSDEVPCCTGTEWSMERIQSPLLTHPDSSVKKRARGAEESGGEERVVL